MLKVDLHTHSIASPDGGITEKEYEEIIAKRLLDVVAITDHNRIDFAEKLHKKLGNTIIIGEEIMTQQGEVIGLFLTKRVAPHMPMSETIAAIQRQQGVVYIPHPFDSFRKGIGGKALKEHIKNIDIIEGFNGRRIFPWQNTKAEKLAIQYSIPMAASSDAHARIGIGKTYTEVEEELDQHNAKQLLQKAHLHKQYQPFSAYLSPFVNKLKHE